MTSGGRGRAPQPAGRGDAVDPGHAQVHQDDVGGVRVGRGGDLVAVGGLADHRDARRRRRASSVSPARTRASSSTTQHAHRRRVMPAMVATRAAGTRRRRSSWSSRPPASCTRSVSPTRPAPPDRPVGVVPLRRQRVADVDLQAACRARRAARRWTGWPARACGRWSAPPARPGTPSAAERRGRLGRRVHRVVAARPRCPASRRLLDQARDVGQHRLRRGRVAVRRSSSRSTRDHLAQLVEGLVHPGADHAGGPGELLGRGVRPVLQRARRTWPAATAGGPARRASPGRSGVRSSTAGLGDPAALLRLGAPGPLAQRDSSARRAWPSAPQPSSAAVRDDHQHQPPAERQAADRPPQPLHRVPGDPGRGDRDRDREAAPLGDHAAAPQPWPPGWPPATPRPGRPRPARQGPAGAAAPGAARRPAPRPDVEDQQAGRGVR